MNPIRRLKVLQLAIVILLVLSACAVKQGTVLHPGQANTFDGQAYDTILTMRAALQQVSVEVVNFP